MDDIPRNPLLTEDLCVSALSMIRRWLVAQMPAIKQHLTTKKLLPTLSPTLAKLEAVLAQPLQETSGDAALVQSHRELMKTGLQKDIIAHGEEIEKARQHRRLIRKESNLNCVSCFFFFFFTTR